MAKKTRAACLGLLLAGCATTSSSLSPDQRADQEAEALDLDSTDAPADAEPDSLDATGEVLTITRDVAPRVACYFGELLVARPGERETNQGALLVKLTMDQASSRMVEETWSFPLYEHFVVTRDITGNRFTQRQDDGGFTGGGSLEGQPWIWHGWNATSTSTDQTTRVQSRTRFENGVLVTREEVRNSGSAATRVRHSLDEIPLDECANMFTKARVNAAKLRAARVD